MTWDDCNNLGAKNDAIPKKFHEYQGHRHNLVATKREYCTAQENMKIIWSLTCYVILYTDMDGKVHLGLDKYFQWISFMKGV